MGETISLVIPAYRERENIVRLVEQLHEVLDDYRILIVDDDSGDGTAELVASLAQHYPVNLLLRREKRGLASAVVDGIGEVGGDILVIMDADLQHPPQVVPELVREIDRGAEIAVASRYVVGGACQGWGMARRFISRGAILLAHILLPSTRRVRDPMSGFFAFRRRVVSDVELNPTGYKILLELLVRGKYRGVAEVPYTFRTRDRGKSKLGLRQQAEYLRHLYRLMRSSGELKRFLSFCAVGLSGVLVNMGLLWFLTEVTGLLYLISAVISIEAAIISNFALNSRLTFRDRYGKGIVPNLRRLLKFNLVSLGGLAINLGVLWLLTDIAGVYYLLSNLAGIATATLWNYVLSTWWTWR